MTQSSAIRDSRPGGPAADVARVAGRGTVYITVAKLWFMASGFGIHFILPRLMGKDSFGLYSVVIGIVSIVNAVIVTGTYQTVSKYISQEEAKADAVKSKALRLQAAIGGAIALGFFLLAPVTASYLNDPRLVDYLRLASLITLAYSFYSVYTGYFNGRRRFLTQSMLDMTYSTLKLVFIVALVWLGYGVAGGVGGFALAAISVLLISAFVAGKGRGEGEVRASELLRFQAYLLAFTFVLNLLQKVDLILVKGLSSPEAGVADLNAGSYSAAVNVANITYQVIISVTFVIFPLVSQATFRQDRDRTRGYIANTVRYTLMVMALLATLFSANAGEVLGVIYPQSYQDGSGALSVIAYGMLCFGLLQVMTTIITASGRPTVSLVVGAATLAVSALLNSMLIPSRGTVGAAISTTVAMFIGVMLAGGYLLSRFGALIAPLSLLRIGVCAGVVFFASILLTPASVPLILAQLAGLSLAYAAMLVLTGELARHDLDSVKKVLGK